MLRKSGVLVILVAVSASAFSLSISAPRAAAASLPEIMASPDNRVPQCVTPGRMMAFLKLRNPMLNPRYEGIATQYMRFGEQLGLRWDFAFYQMVFETGALSYTGDVRPDQNNFAGLGATGHREHGESFKDIETGVLAHLQHVLLYAGHPVPNPVAERTRNIRDWGVLTGWQESLGHPVTYADLTTKWAPGNRSYVAMLRGIEDHFDSAVCHRPDPNPEMVQEARALIEKDTGAAKVAAEAPPAQLTPGEELAQRALAETKENGTARRSGLGVEPPAAETVAAAVPYKVASVPAAKAPALETKAAPKAAEATVSDTKVATAVSDTKSGATTKAPAAGKAGTRYVLAGAGAAATKLKTPSSDIALPPAANQRCRVWTASYGGQKSLIIRSVADQVVNFTVLDVNDGSEAREAEAFIAAYAKNGIITGPAYPNQAQALDKAFELCPEG
jgi:hypothetical protein